MTTTAPLWTERLFSSGFVAGSGEPLPVVEKATGAELGRVGSATNDDLDTAVVASRAAQRAWAEEPYHVRVEVLLRAAALLEAEPQRRNPCGFPETGTPPAKPAYNRGHV